MRHHNPPRLLALAVAASIWLLSAPPCKADLIPVGFDPNGPVIFGGVPGKDTLKYTASTGDFQFSGGPVSFNYSSLPIGFALFDVDLMSGQPIGLITLDVQLTPMGGGFQGPGTISVTGSLDLDWDGITDVSGDVSNPLLFGSMTNFGADPAGPPTVSFNGLFDIQGGLLTQDISLSGGGIISGGFPVGGPPGLFLLSAESVTGGTLGDFSQDFSSDSGKPEVGVSTVPAPPTWVLGLLGAVVLSLFGHFRSNRMQVSASQS
jgi:hypothetical protein